MLCAATVFLSSLLALLLFERANAEVALEVALTLLTPWFAICKAMTPLSWQTWGNIPLFLMWLVSGIAVYSVLIGACLATGSRFLTRSRLPQTASNARETRK